MRRQFVTTTVISAGCPADADEAARLGERVRFHRRAQVLTLVELGKAVGVGHTTFSAIKKGRA